jgi:hypothetical protein
MLKKHPEVALIARRDARSRAAVRDRVARERRRRRARTAIRERVHRIGAMSVDDGARTRDDDDADAGAGHDDALARGLHGSIARSARALDAAHRSASASQDALTSRVEAAAAALETLVSTLPKPASEEHARRLKTARLKLDGLGASAANLRERVEKLHAMASSMKRADLAALAERECADLPPREEVFRAGGDASAGAQQTARVLSLPESVSEALKTLKM